VVLLKDCAILKTAEFVCSYGFVMSLSLELRIYLNSANWRVVSSLIGLIYCTPRTEIAKKLTNRRTKTERSKIQ